MKAAMTGLLAALLLPACAELSLTTPLSDAALAVTLAAPEQVSHCQKLGTVGASVLPRIGIVERSQESQGADLDRLARSEAARLGGDAVVAASPLLDGRRSYQVYRCGQRGG